MTGTKQKIIEWLEKQPDQYFTIKSVKKTRSLEINRLYWLYLKDVVSAFDEKGIFITIEDLHSGLRDKLIEPTIKQNTFTGELQSQRKSTSKLNNKEFVKYLSDIEKYLIQTFEISVPLATDINYNQ